MFIVICHKMHFANLFFGCKSKKSFYLRIKSFYINILFPISYYNSICVFNEFKKSLLDS